VKVGTRKLKLFWSISADASTAFNLQLPAYQICHCHTCGEVRFLETDTILKGGALRPKNYWDPL